MAYAKASRLLAALAGPSVSARSISLPVFLVEELARHLRDFRPGASPSDLVFTGPKGGTLRRSFASRVFRPAVSRAGLSQDLTFHGLRHAATALMVEHGEHPRVIQHRLGHATARLSMELYAHVPEAADRAAAQHLDARFSRGSGTGAQNCRGDGAPVGYPRQSGDQRLRIRTTPT